jgi:hypothetical protein
MLKKFQEFINESLDKDVARKLRELGLAPTDWAVELEIEFDKARQSEPEYIKSIFIGWLPEINSISSDFQVKEDSVDIDEWTEEDYVLQDDEIPTEEDYVLQDDEIPTEDEIGQMRKPKLLDLIDELELDVDTAEATRAGLGELRDLITTAIEDLGFGSMNYGQRNFIRFTISTATDNEAEVRNWIETNVTDSRVFTDIENLERVD